MLSYLDRTFCTQNTCSKRDTCGNYFSEAHKKRAQEVCPIVSMALFYECFVPESAPLTAQGHTDANN